jgi:protein-disulfide isomerase
MLNLVRQPGAPGFIVGTELAPGALDLKGLKELIVRAGK